MSLYSSPGSIFVEPLSQRPCYYASFTGAAASAATDYVTLNGDGTKWIIPLFVAVWGTATAAVAAPVNIIWRSTLDTSGTATQPTIIKSYQAQPASIATVNLYSANPTTGTSRGTLMILPMNVTATTGSPVPALFDFGSGLPQPPVLTSATDQLCINLNAATYAGNTLYGFIAWTEGSL